MSTPNSERPADTEVDQRPTVASVAAVASTTDDLEAAQPTHPDRPVGVNVDTAGLGTEPGDSEDLPADETLPVDEELAEGHADLADDEEGLGAETDAADSRDA
jgi:hypothetical protein